MRDRNQPKQSTGQTFAVQKIHLPGQRCPLSSAIVTARLDPWLPVVSRGVTTLYGYCRWHEELGGLSWLMSSAVRELDEGRLRARTASGRVYALGQRIEADELPDEEARVVFRFMTGSGAWRADPVPHADLFWLSSLKVARWLGKEPPPRGKIDELWEFLATTRVAYLAALRAAGVRPR